MFHRILVVLGLCAWGLTLSAQSWDELRGLKAGDQIKVLDTGGREYKGAFRSVSNDAISLDTGKNEAAIERPRVRRVEVRSGSRRARNAVIGAAVGLAIGVLVDQTLGAYLRNETGESGRAVTYVAPIALFGGLGAAFPAYKTLYRLK